MAVKSNLEKIYEVKCGKGHYIFKLNSLLEKKNKTKNSVIVKKEIDFNSMQKLVTGNLTRIDLTIIAKLCNELECKLEDIVEYVNDPKTDDKN
ncbi:MAG: helix-turn-helix transcriptional regulator [Bacilli bacterium]|nr:helix-turn-helix transcriptional regulator [Bacilli bacterium]